MADAVIEGKAIRGGGAFEEEDESPYETPDFDDDAGDEDLLGASTLQKLRGSKLDFDEDDED
jgi:hypothetical protein